MNFAKFFIDRPIFAAVLSIVLTLTGGIALFTLPIEQYPQVVPPTVLVTARYPGANPEVLAQTVARPIEQEINGVENMLYMSSNSTSDGTCTIIVTFKLGTDLDIAQVQVQNRVAVAEARLPEDVRRLGVTTVKQSPNFTLVVNLISPDNSLSDLYVGNYALLNLKDQLARLPGVGLVQNFGGSEYSMRIWLDPDKISSRNMTVTDVVNAIREQNVQAAAGILGAPPAPMGTDYQLTISTQGRLIEVAEFENIIVKSGDDGQVTRVKDVARVELAGRDYNMESYLDGQATGSLGVFQLPGSNALETSAAVRERMEELKQSFPPGLDYRIVYDTTMFTQKSIDAVIHTFIEALILVVLVVIIFLQNWRASIIPLLAVPVSIIGTFLVMKLFGFSLNNLTMFGLVLAIGIVVDDAIVVVENVERNIALGLTPLAATRRAMEEVSGPVIGVAIVLTAVFVPTAFMTGLTGQFYRQFALTIAVATVISAFNSLTLSPALSAILLKPHGAKPDWFQRLINFTLGWLFNGFNWLFEKFTNGYTGIVRRALRFSVIALLIYVGLLFLTGRTFTSVPAGFVPTSDKGYLIAFAQLPDAASIERTRKVTNEMTRIARSIPGVAHSIEIPGFHLLSGGSAMPNAGTLFIILEDFELRAKDPNKSMGAILGQISGAYGAMQEAMVFCFPPPPVDGLGNTGGFKLQIKDNNAQGKDALAGVAFNMMQKANTLPGLTSVFTTMRPNVPQIRVDVDRFKAKSMGIRLADIFETLQTCLGSIYVNDFNRFGRVYQVTAQAEAKFRVKPSDITRLKVRNDQGQMVPLGTLVTIHETTGLDIAASFNTAASADLSGSTLPGVSSGQAIAMMENLAKTELPRGFTFDWTELTLQEILAGNSAIFIFPLCVIFVFLALAAQYESWSLPLAIILIVPLVILAALWGVIWRGMDNNIFTQIGFVVLVGLASKNAILIVEFAKQLEDQGKNIFDATVEAARLRLRPILMTSLAFILGVTPLVLASGAGSEMRQALGTAVFFGMIGVTIFGLVLTPVFYLVIRKLTVKFSRKKAVSEDHPQQPPASPALPQPH
ncbi:multidrug efflux RND transporter permease subunit [Phragmitibacter flavus]|uniref:Multidrug efflux RND transporter permease subunit n=1 Tax=Phragmitibacter flavus TaxID=2576071 RepID=A0A5R8K9T9_9BACT|nr:multidrug efflux RND transporter permease subunit [Phragmitibacter flavus]TLD68685.1 multidrug efflux RND transporter permease subunit [Phragmitibacter flavus]